MKDVVILGAGITGLTTAHNLKKKGSDILLLEEAPRAGGVINTVAENGFVYEEGPNSGVIGNVEVIRLFEDLKGLCELEVANDNMKKRYILKNSKWQALPSGPISAIKTPLFTLKDKFRILGEPFRPAGNNPDETLAEMVVRRLGQSFLDYAVDPFILGVYAGDPTLLITRYALPKLYNLEHNYGSLIGETIKKACEHKTNEERKVTRDVFSVKGGLSSLINALSISVGGNIFTGISDVIVEPVDRRFVVSYKRRDGLSDRLQTKKVISTIGAHRLNKVLTFIEPTTLSKIASLRYARVIEVVLGFNKWNGMKIDAFGGLIPCKEKHDLLGVLFMSTLFERRAPEDGALFSIFLGGMRNPEICDLPDDKVKEILRREFTPIMKLDEFKPDLLKILRHDHAIPQYEIDSGERFSAVEKIEKQYPGLIIGGNLKNGIGMADRIQQARMLADAV